MKKAGLPNLDLIISYAKDLRNYNSKVLYG